MSRFIKNVFKLGSATAIAQLLGILLTPIITRLYSPADFGIYQVFISIVLIVGTISCLSYHSSILLPDSDRDALHIVILCFILILGASIIAGITFWIFSDWFEKTLNAPGLAWYIPLLPIGIFLNGSILVLSLWLSRQLRFGTIAVSRVASSISNKMVQIGMGLTSASPLGLIAGSLVNDASTSIVMLKGIKYDRTFFSTFSFCEIRKLAIRFKNFPIFSSGSALAEVGYFNYPSFMLAFFFNASVVGYYALAFTVVKLPSKLIGSAVYSVFYQKASEEMKRSGGLHNVVKQVHRRLISIGFFPFLILIVIGEDLFSIVFGAEWYTAGLYIKILAPWMFMLFISEPMISIFNVLERLRMNFSFNIAILLSGLIALYFGGISGDPVFSLLLFSGAGIILYAFRYIYLLHIAGTNIKDSILDTGRFLLIGFVVISPLIVWKFLTPGSIMLIILAAVLAIVYYGVIVWDDRVMREEFLRLITRRM